MSSLREVAAAADATDTDWPGVYTASYVSRRLTGQDDAGTREAEFIAAADPPTVLALLDVVTAARRFVFVRGWAPLVDDRCIDCHADIRTDQHTDECLYDAMREALARLPEEVRDV